MNEKFEFPESLDLTEIGGILNGKCLEIMVGEREVRKLAADDTLALALAILKALGHEPILPEFKEGDEIYVLIDGVMEWSYEKVAIYGFIEGGIITIKHNRSGADISKPKMEYVCKSKEAAKARCKELNAKKGMPNHE